MDVEDIQTKTNDLSNTSKEENHVTDEKISVTDKGDENKLKTSFEKAPIEVKLDVNEDSLEKKLENGDSTDLDIITPDKKNGIESVGKENDSDSSYVVEGGIELDSAGIDTTSVKDDVSQDSKSPITKPAELNITGMWSVKKTWG